MFKNKKITQLSMFLFMFLMVFLCLYSFIRLPSLQAEIIAKEEDKKVIDLYLTNTKSNLKINETALAMLSENKLGDDQNIKYAYRTAEGIDMISYSDSWNVSKLEALYNELKLNVHGEEFDLLDRVVIHGESDAYAAGAHSNLSKTIELIIKLPSLPFNSTVYFPFDMSVINLYNGDEYNQVADMAIVLSHEYGHHFTFYHMFKDKDFTNSEYETVRNIQGVEVFYDYANNYQHYLNNHDSYLIEIAADDYVQLMGSPMTKNVSKYVDVRQRLYGAKHPKQWRSYNGYIQGNVLIPFADEVDGLAEYFYRFVDEDPPEKLSYSKKNLNLSISIGSSSHQGSSGPLNFTHYVISWNNAYDQAIYTLICADPDGKNAYPIKTVYPNQTTNAYIGTVSYETATMIYWQYDNIDKGKKIFFVNILLPDNTLIRSDILEYTFR